VSDVFVNDPPALSGPALTWKPGEPPVGQSALPQAAPPPGSALPDYAPYGGSNITGLAPGSSDYVSSRLADEAAAKGEAQTYVDRRAEDQMRQDRQKMAQSYALESADARDPALRPWNAEQEKAKYIRGPMENFGSVGMIFAMAASAFTRTPMISALNAGAAAMQATAQSDEKAYKQYFDAWKSNSDLALKRFDMERNLYEDANKLLTTDMGLWKQKSLMLAAQFDNQKMRIMLENGMDKEVLDVQAAQFKASEEMRKSKFEFEKQDFFRQQYADSIKEYQDAHPGVNDENKTPEYVAFKAKAWSDALRASQGDLTPEQLRATSAGGARTLAAERVDAIEKAKAEFRAAHDGREPNAAETNKIISQAVTNLSGNKQVELQERAYKFTHSEEIIDRVEHELQAHAMSAGIPGKALRLEERLSNMVSAGAIKDSDRVQMMRDVNFLQLWGKELLTSKNDRLKSTGDRIDSIIAGLSAGDTTANTLRSLRELKKLYATMRSETEQELGRPVTAAPSAAPAPPPTSGKKPWANDAPSP
jgi:hypothetical protein